MKRCIERARQGAFGEEGRGRKRGTAASSSSGFGVLAPWTTLSLDSLDRTATEKLKMKAVYVCVLLGFLACASIARGQGLGPLSSRLGSRIPSICTARWPDKPVGLAAVATAEGATSAPPSVAAAGKASRTLTWAVPDTAAGTGPACTDGFELRLSSKSSPPKTFTTKVPVLPCPCWRG